jgi:hypothetical protein
VLTEENFKFSPQKPDYSILLFDTVCMETSKTESKQKAQWANDSNSKSCPQYSVWKLLCQSPVEGQVDLEVVEKRCFIHIRIFDGSKGFFPSSLQFPDSILGVQSVTHFFLRHANRPRKYGIAPGSLKRSHTGRGSASFN